MKPMVPKWFRVVPKWFREPLVQVVPWVPHPGGGEPRREPRAQTRRSPKWFPSQTTLSHEPAEAAAKFSTTVNFSSLASAHDASGASHDSAALAHPTPARHRRYRRARHHPPRPAAPLQALLRTGDRRTRRRRRCRYRHRRPHPAERTDRTSRAAERTPYLHTLGRQNRNTARAPQSVRHCKRNTERQTHYSGASLPPHSRRTSHRHTTEATRRE